MQGPLTVVLQLLLVAGAVGLVAKRLQVHYNIALVLAGVVVGSLHWLPPAHLDPEIVIHVFLPILLFEAAISTDLRRLRENLTPVLLLAVPGILLSVAVIGLVVREGLGLAWPLALLLGSILAATDTIAVIATVRKVRAPARLTTILENDSLFNDGTALVAFSTILAFMGPGRCRNRPRDLDSARSWGVEARCLAVVLVPRRLCRHPRYRGSFAGYGGELSDRWLRRVS